MEARFCSIARVETGGRRHSRSTAVPDMPDNLGIALRFVPVVCELRAVTCACVLARVGLPSPRLQLRARAFNRAFYSTVPDSAARLHELHAPKVAGTARQRSLRNGGEYKLQ